MRLSKSANDSPPATCAAGSSSQTIESSPQAGIQTALSFAATQLLRAGCFVGDKIDEFLDTLIPGEPPSNGTSTSEVENGEWIIVDRPSSSGLSPHSAAGIGTK
mmetsp:Transcript_8637/g.7337  ORF Transcript_8637/g.7337 Transcript_8637/m.7337 type:complete len:104 (-) Transcript_8637:169-480(-)